MQLTLVHRTLQAVIPLQHQSADSWQDVSWIWAGRMQTLSWIQTPLARNAARSRHRALQAETSIQQPGNTTPHLTTWEDQEIISYYAIHPVTVYFFNHWMGLIFSDYANSYAMDKPTVLVLDILKLLIINCQSFFIDIAFQKVYLKGCKKWSGPSENLIDSWHNRHLNCQLVIAWKCVSEWVPST